MLTCNPAAASLPLASATERPTSGGTGDPGRPRADGQLHGRRLSAGPYAFSQYVEAYAPNTSCPTDTPGSPGRPCTVCLGLIGFTSEAAETRCGVIPTNHNAELASSVALLSVPVFPAMSLPPLAYHLPKYERAVPVWVSARISSTTVRATYWLRARWHAGRRTGRAFPVLLRTRRIGAGGQNTPSLTAAP